MKFSISVLSILVLFSSLAEASDARRKPAPKRSSGYESYERTETRSASNLGMAGCGLGSIVIEDNSKWAQVGSAFLNGTGMQTFGITFGTSNCVEDGVSQASKEKEAFVESNLADLRRDVAAGEGEYLSSLASLYGCEGASAEKFNQALHKNSSIIVGASSEAAAPTIDSVVKAEDARCEG